MTELTITPKTADKTARFKGAIAAGEHVAVTIKGGAEWLGEDNGAHLSLRVLDLVTGRTLAIFPRPPETEEADSVSEPSASADAETAPETETEPQTDSWSTTGEDNADLYCELNLNTTRMVNAARHMLQVPVLFVMGEKDDQSDAVTRTLYFRDRHEVGFWPERIGDDTPYDLDRWPKQIDEWTELVEGWTERLNGLILSAERFTDKEVGGVLRNGVTIMLNDGDDDTDTVVDLYDGEVSATQMNTAIAAMGATKVDKTTTVNGHALSDDVTVSKSDVGLGNVANTGDSATPVSGGTTKFTTGGAYTELGKKADKVSSPTAGNFAGLNASGNLVDSGKKALDFATAADKANLQSAISDEALARASAVSSESSARQSADSALSSRLSTLEGEDTSKSVREIAAEEVAKIVANADSDLDTLKEIADFLSDDQTAGTVAKRLSDLESGKVDVVSGKGLSTNDYTTTEKTKLAGIAAGAEVNVQSDWNQTNSSADDYIKNKPDVASCLTRAEAVDGYTKWEVDTIASGKTLVSCEWHEGTAPDRGWVVSMIDGGASVSLLIAGEPDATSLTYPDLIALSRVRIHPAIDSALSPTSENPVQNKAVKAALDGKRGVLDLAVYADGFTEWELFSSGGDDLGSGKPSTLQADTWYWGDDEAAPSFIVYFSEGRWYFTDTNYTESVEGSISDTELSISIDNSIYTLIRSPAVVPTQDALVRASQLAAKADKYPFTAASVESGVLTLQNAAVQTWTPGSGESVAIAAPTGTSATARDMELVIDCSSLAEGDEPTVTWDTHFHPRTDAWTDFACVAGVRNVYYISEYAPGEFAAGGWQETEGGNA